MQWSPYLQRSSQIPSRGIKLRITLSPIHIVFFLNVHTYDIIYELNIKIVLEKLFQKQVLKYIINLSECNLIQIVFSY